MSSNQRVKMFEVRDRSTMILVLAVKLGLGDPREERMLRKCGYGPQQLALGEEVMVTRLGGKYVATTDPHEHGSGGYSCGRTMPAAHRHMINFWGSLETGAVIDVEYILGETTSPKESEFV